MSPEAGPLSRRDGEPTFAEPWQAETMALAARLVEQGRFSAAQWSAVLGEEIRRAADLWPEAAASPDRIFLDLWESYLEP